MDRVADQVKRLSERETQVKIDNLRQKMIEGIVHEQLAPLKRNLNIDLKKLRRHIEECLATNDDH